MERYKLRLSYEGSGFAGSQRQLRRRTVQAELEKALRPLGWTGRSVLLAGRTDAGVHALGQVAAFDLQWNHGRDELRDALNATLPSDMAVLSVDLVDSSFHPRFDASARRYRYRIYCQPIRDPLRERLMWRVWPAVHVADLQEVASMFCGRHDFAAFGSAPGKRGSTIRTVSAAGWEESQDERRFEIEADGFLYRMVRKLVFVQMAVAQGRATKEAVNEALRSASRSKALPAGLAPAHGLALVDVNY
jgi:tRNA pseudouridine38-40 synthase